MDNEFRVLHNHIKQLSISEFIWWTMSKELTIEQIQLLTDLAKEYKDNLKVY